MIVAVKILTSDNSNIFGFFIYAFPQFGNPSDENPCNIIFSFYIVRVASSRRLLLLPYPSLSSTF